ncbi:mechanosensitive ion channel protein MscS [Vandammella animalimorsus]|uniref:Mechanosensitive ion channel protein MscS n=1 Tax=Vandammella animalimorsus TaxID=2029117 RepID=A0A2A2AR90_9BURK|nr:mechanosensitive ion channel family protein [Vandammella animalimorsus]PAT40273.1 mechanosensitive ion channel protein MscS [Vandammella animalimorsus]
MRLLASYLQVSSDPSIWAVQLFAIVFATVCCNFVLLRVLDFFGRVTSHTRSIWDDALLQAARLPLRLMVWVIGLSAAVALLNAIERNALFAHVDAVRRVLLIAIAALFVLRFIRNMEANLTDAQRNKRPVDKTTVYAVGKLLRLSVVITAALVALQTLGFSVSGVLAFGGIGGMAIGFAAKDMLANFFGGLMIYLDKPFTVGDWIRSPDRQIEGTVEDIGWRITRIRTFDKRPLYVPNSLFTSIVVENPSRMLHRRIHETMGIRYEDQHKMAAICDAVRAMLRSHPDIATEQTIIVHFNACSDSSLDFMVYCFTKTTEWVRFHAIKEQVMLKIMDIVAEHGAQFAYPTRALFLAGDAEHAPVQLASVAAGGAAQQGAD